MSGANGFGRFFGGSASEIPPMARPPAPPPDSREPLQFPTQTVVEPAVTEPAVTEEVVEAAADTVTEPEVEVAEQRGPRWSSR